MSLRVALAVVAALSAGPLAGCQSLPLETQPWIEVRSESFRFVSQVSAEETVELARSLELFRHVVRRMTTAKALEPRVPTTILLLKERSAYLQLGYEYTAGLFVASQRANYAVVDGSGGGGLDAKGVLLHEYTHYVVNNDQIFSYPLWYNEGFAELMRGTAERGNDVIVGRPLRDRVIPPEAHRQLSLRRLMTESPRDYPPVLVSIYYARAWLLVQYLNYGSEAGFPNRAKQLHEYLVRVHDGMPEDQACQEAFGTSFELLDDELEKYIRLGKVVSFKAPRSMFPETPAPQLRSLAPDEVAAELGNAALVLRNGERAEGYFRSMLALRPESARAQIGLADALRMQGREKGAYEPLYERALELGSDDALTQLDYAEYRMAMVRGLASDPAAAEQRRELLTGAREHLRRAIELDPELPEAHAQLGATYLVFPDQRDSEQGFREVERAHQLLASDSDITYLMALGHFQSNRLDDARRFIELTRSRTHEPSEAVEKLADEIEAARGSAQAAPPQPGVGATP